MRLAVMLSFLAGLRVGEIAALSVVDVVDGEVRFTPNKKHSLAGTPSLPGITWLRCVVYYHGVVGRLAHTMVKVSQKWRRWNCGETSMRGEGAPRETIPYPPSGSQL